MTIVDEEIQKLLNGKSPRKENWREINDFLSFAKNCDNDDDVLIYFSRIHNPQCLDYHTIIEVLIKDDKLSKLPDTNGMMPTVSAWSLWGGDPQCEGKVFLCEEKDGYESLFFVRNDFAARTENEKNLNVEIYQKFTHVLDLHCVPHKKAYCAYNDLGELVEVVRICISKEYKYITIKRKYLDKYLHITKKTLVKYLNCWRFLPNLSNYKDNK
ncbi:MAG: hypothetical protein LBD61_00710 [Endomicrobium sp.]|jgi:hypothetical protein|nr:hypothetical protein [Endomicrobium sp.]